MNSKENQITITVIGFGNVGRAVVHHLIQHPNPYIINIMDPSEHTEGSWLDLNHAAMLQPQHELKRNCADTFNASDFVFHCAGKGVAPGASRLSIVMENKELTQQIFENFKPTKDPKIIVVTNPVDIISYYTWKYSGVASYKVIGTGSWLDTERMNFYIKEHTNTQKPIRTMLIGEHGQSVVWMKSHSYIGAIPITEGLTISEQDLLFQKTLDAAKTIKATQTATIYGVADVAVSVMRELITPQNLIVPVSTLISPEYKQLLNCGDIFISIPVLLDHEGAHPIPMIKMTAEELTQLQNSAQVIEENRV